METSGARTETKIRGIRKAIGERMTESLATTAQFTLHAWTSAVAALELRASLKASDPSKGLAGATIGDILNAITVRTLREFRYVNAHRLGDTYTEYEDIHLGVACDTPRGLMVPVVRDAGHLSLRALSEETKRLAEACRSGTVKLDELSGSTFTVTNLGSTGVELFTPVLNIPEVAILGFGSISQRPVARGSGIALEPAVGLSLTVNHAVVDGAPAARFLGALVRAIAECSLEP